MRCIGPGLVEASPARRSGNRQANTRLPVMAYQAVWRSFQASEWMMLPSL
jgi:hypothetical protein